MTAIFCDIVNSSKNFHEGKRSIPLASLPITYNQPLNSTMTFFKNVDIKVPYALMGY